MENSIEDLKQRLQELYQTQQARLDVGTDDLDIREEISEVEAEIKELEDDINEENNNGNDTNVGSIENSIEEDIKILEELRIANENCIKIARITDFPFMVLWKKQNKAIEHILSDYKRVLKENEELLELKVSASAHNRMLELEKENKELKTRLDEINEINFPIIN